MTSLIGDLSHNERDFDRLLIEELAFGQGFLDSFADKIGFPTRPLKSIRHSVDEHFSNEAWGETDIFLEFQDGSALLIENKLSAPFQPDQASRYRARARIHARRCTEVWTVLIAPLVYLQSVPKDDWDMTCSYAAIADCIHGTDPRNEWRRSLLLWAGNRAARMRTLATNSGARKDASKELVEFKTAWHAHLWKGSEWVANPQHGATDEFLYAPKSNPLNLRIWHHPCSGYLSVQNLQKLDLDISDFQSSLPEGFVLRQHPLSIYLDAQVPGIDMSASFEVELENVESSLAIARRAVDLVELAFRLR